jgi:hypothetical protein
MRPTTNRLLRMGAALAAILWAQAAAAQTASTVAPATAAPTLSDAVAAGKLILEIRPRFEEVEQSGFKQDATGYTVRTHLGWETGAWHGVVGLIELSDVQGIGAERYNTTVNGKTALPTIADPDQARINRAQLTWTATDWLTATVGRQRIQLDDERFIGDVNWRQNEQVFDAARADFNFGKLTASYIYIDQVDRVFGDTLDWRGNTDLFTAAYAFAGPLKLQAFDYLLDFTTNTAAAKAASTATAGVKVSGKLRARAFKFAYGATYAQERNYGSNPARYRLDYDEGDLAGTYGVLTIKAKYESLQGDGVHGFSTPLATIHPLDGWDDVFLTTPAKGLKDASLAVSVRPPVKLAHLFNTELFARYHDFTTETTNRSLGREWDLQATGQITPKLSALLKYADYKGVTGFASRNKTWVGLEYKF